MKATSEINNSITYNATKVILTFDDKSEVELFQISDYDFDFCSGSSSTISITNSLNNVELLNRYNKKITFLHIEFKVYNLENLEYEDKMFLDIPCYMGVSRIRFNQDAGNCGEMSIDLEGMVY